MLFIFSLFQARTGLKPRNDDELDNEIKNPLAEIPDIKLPKSHDWRDFNAITAVKNQGSCGSCWAVRILNLNFAIDFFYSILIRFFSLLNSK